MTEWMDAAACVHVDIAIFFPEPKRPGAKLTSYAQARQVCARCTVREECLAHAMSHELQNNRLGMYGGLTPEQRDRLRRRPRAAA